MWSPYNLTELTDLKDVEKMLFDLPLDILFWSDGQPMSILLLVSEEKFLVLITYPFPFPIIDVNPS
jgi:hypothetical protein